MQDEHDSIDEKEERIQLMLSFPIPLAVPCPNCNPGRQGVHPGYSPTGAWGDYVSENGHFPPEGHPLRQTECEWGVCPMCEGIGFVPTEYGAAQLAFYDTFTEDND